ncbi:unnamed protein product [Medioppia subpectinata]|uniref:Uncharacterized protein n=1 Tax=Medioppia subpectinata TaxID=1979941 RepID=A0A7R9Q1E6_9ACAR|nr:unnamed protein product [Medioppia subpectinata]CAG2109154.1 unnamed protein product [Medioppia subpectinata]
MVMTSMANRSHEELIELFQQLKHMIRDDTREKEALRQRLLSDHNNEDWNQTLVDQLRRQLTECHTCIDTQRIALQEFQRMKETNNGLKEEINRSNETLKSWRQSSHQLVQRVRNESDERNDKLSADLNAKCKEMEDLKLTIASKDLDLNELRRELSDEKNKSGQNVEQIKEFYENKIQCLYREFDDNLRTISKTNDQKIIDIKADCLVAINRTQEELGQQLEKYKNENKELNEKYSHLRLESEARKMTNRFVNANRNQYKFKSTNASTSDTKPKLSIRVLDSDDDSSGPTVELVPQKRKKLMQNNDSYLDFLKQSP